MACKLNPDFINGSQQERINGRVTLRRGKTYGCGIRNVADVMVSMAFGQIYGVHDVRGEIVPDECVSGGQRGQVGE